MLSDEWPDFGALSPAAIGGTPVKLHVYVPDSDEVVAREVAAGATLMRPVSDQFYGDRSGMIADPFGHVWFVATLKERVAPTEMQRRWDAALAGAA
jgi:PhnB protein